MGIVVVECFAANTLAPQGRQGSSARQPLTLSQQVSVVVLALLSLVAAAAGALQVEYRVAAINCDFGSVWLAPNARGVEENMCVIQARTGYAKVKTPEQSCDGACVDVENMLQQE
ncbi:hypothetical protein PR002_g1165 [Phytophthora rubi]|uniref:Uncharacterized protein n=1 Tax=Phytophthora rubi TaxID=129364 RepID=A0A6A3NWV1_9STRA|nr:hypothetical protein PR002_g1165 [Phytophthora rubi]